MKITPSISSYSHLVFVFLVINILSCLICPSHSHDAHHDFLQCLKNSVSGPIYTPNHSSYSSILTSTIQNRRFASASAHKPLLVVTPVHESDIRAVVLCSKQHGIQIRTRSGGHCFEGLSYATTSQLVPYVVIDLVNLDEVTVDATQKTAWVETGALLGQVYYAISKESSTLAFPGATSATVGVGGHISGGGFGQLLRKYGLAADNVVDARLIDVNGNILDRKSMGEDLFWAIRGGGGASFGVITAWKLKLVPVPEQVTIFSVTKSLEQNAIELIRKWQCVAPNLPNDYHFTVKMQRVVGETNTKIKATFECMFLGEANAFLQLFEERFPELGAKREDCTELSWIQAVLYFAGYSVHAPPQVLASRTPLTRPSFKGKTDYVQEPITESGLSRVWNYLHEADRTATVFAVFIPYGGRMNEISESALPFPHREGNLYEILYMVKWDKPAQEIELEAYKGWSRKLYRYMTPHVSKFPRAAYLNFRDLDLGVINLDLDDGNTNYAHEANITWGVQYFKNNFNRLVEIKTMVDPGNFFRNEQSIPPFTTLNGGTIEGVLSNLLEATA